ncbi:MAG TPA: PfkB family carbohydrate kinase [Longimicrobiales bacterium]|nr:PfkB family carbohydrate kinase [Longimicrobiales bacterium]
MSLLVVGSLALDTIETPFGQVTDALGGSATYFSASACHFHPVQLVGVVGGDFPLDQLDFLAKRGVDLAGLERAEGESFRWSGVYSHDLNNPETRQTRLGVFADFRPRIPDEFRNARWVFLANIDPDLQHEVLDQVRSPRLVACDTMNYWIESKRESLLALLPRVDALFINDSEIRKFTGDHNLVRAARWVQERGPSIVVVKKGEHGAMLFHEDSLFFAPGYPLEDVFDPTGAGDSFAGGFLGYIANVGGTEPATLRRAMIYGSAMGSFAVERFSVERLRAIEPSVIHTRVREFQAMTAFEHALPALV